MELCHRSPAERALAPALALAAALIAAMLVATPAAAAEPDRSPGTLPATAPSGVTYWVTSTANSGVGSLRQAIVNANANLGADTISFNINPGGSPFIDRVIDITTQLPAVTDTVTISGPNANGAPIVLDGGGNPAQNRDGLVIGASDSTVRNLSVRNFGATGIRVWMADRVTLQGNCVGACPNAIFAGNYGDGIMVYDSFGSIVGGSTPSAANVIVGNGGDGVSVEQGGRNQILGNYIGVSASGTVSQANQGEGISIINSSGNVVGGATSAQRNVIAGNLGSGVYIYGDASYTNTVVGNFLGTDRTGSVAIPNRVGVWVAGTISTTIGGSAQGAGNLIAGSELDGLYVAAGTSILATGPVIMGNSVGVNVTSTATIPNARHGINLGGTQRAVVGGELAGEANTVAGNGGAGINFTSVGSSANPVATVRGNRIGLLPGGAAAPNAGAGIAVAKSNIVIGGVAPGQGNAIAYNGGVGVRVAGFTVTVRGNSVYSNTALGIDIVPDGVTPNDEYDADTGYNGLQNYPEILGAVRSGSTITITGQLRSNASTAFDLDFFANTACDPGAYGEGESFLGTKVVTTTVVGSTSFSATFANLPDGKLYLTSTATDPEGDTSEFSACYYLTRYVYLPLALRQNP